MCSRYTLTGPPAEITRVFEIAQDRVVDLPLPTDIMPKHMAPVVRADGVARELVLMSWGFPCTPSRGPAHLVTTTRNPALAYWRPWLTPEFRCLVPVSCFSAYSDAKPSTGRAWFALEPNLPLFAFAGIWRPWFGTRGPGPKRAVRAPAHHQLFSILTTEPNGVVAPVHGNAMPVLLTSAEMWHTWLEAPAEEALRLQRPPPDAVVRLVSRE